MEERLGVPTFLWAGEYGRISSAGLKKAPSEPEQAARHHVSRYAHLYRLDQEIVEALKLRSVHDTGRGMVVVSLYQEVNGAEVFRDEIRLAMNRGFDLVAISGFVTRPETRSRVFHLGLAAAIAEALEDLTGYGFMPRDLQRIDRGRADTVRERFVLTPRAVADSRFSTHEPIRARRVWFRLVDGLEPAWQIDFAIGSTDSTDAQAYGYVVSAVDGEVLLRKDFTVADSFTYRVWADPNDTTPYDGPQGTAPSAHPTGTPSGFQPSLVPQALVTLESGSIGTGDPWLNAGATQTIGNNVDAYADVSSPDGFSAGDLRASTTSLRTFDRVYDTSQDPDVTSEQRNASITQLFYVNNWLHDWFYDSGFDEASGNAQASNYGRGGLEGDSLRAEAQDYSGRNNANMSTPPDGSRPRMQMYIFDGSSLDKVVVSAPASIAGTYPAGPADFGPQTFNITGLVALVNDGAGATSDGCQTPFANAAQILGKVALLDRGACSFVQKVVNAEAAGAIGALIANNTAGIVAMPGGGFTIPALSITQVAGSAFKAHLTGLEVTMSRAPQNDKDGAIDNQIVTHEWGHYISNRLIGNGFGLLWNMARGLGEGWADFHALLLTVREEDAVAPAGHDWSGAYPIASYAVSGPANEAYYFGIRRAPYSTDPNINPLTFKHIENGVQLPAGAPLAFGQSGATNAESHNTGEIWANMLWECYASLLRDTLGPTPRLTFPQAQQRMKDYLVAGYKMTPNEPTLIEARDALLTAAYASDLVDYERCWAAFAERGAGVGAVGPDRFSSTNGGVEESFAVGGALDLVSISLADDIATDCLPDGVLDSGEVGTLTVRVVNTGSVTLSSSTGTITSTNPSVSLPAGNILSFPSLGPFGSSTASVTVAIMSAAGIGEAGFNIAINDPGFAFAGPIDLSSSFRINSDEIQEASATDDVESPLPAWMVATDSSLDTSLPFRRVKITGSDNRWLGPDMRSVSDSSLVSPALVVASSGTFGFTFRHRHDFEAASGTFFDGGVIEMSTNGGATWTDIGGSITAQQLGYNGTLNLGGGNPLEGRMAFSGTSPGHPSFVTVAVDLGTAYQGQTVLVRFRIGTDVFVGAPGWEIDDISFSGITNTPFPIQVPHNPTCDADTDSVVDTADCAPLNGSLWGPPSPVLDVTADRLSSGEVMYSWTSPTDLGGLAEPTYDAVVSSSAGNFLAGACIESSDTNLAVVAMAEPPPGSIEYILIGARSACGRTFAPDSAGEGRLVAACTP